MNNEEFKKRFLSLEFNHSLEVGNCLYTRVPGGYIVFTATYNGYSAFSHFIPLSEIEKDGDIL